MEKRNTKFEMGFGGGIKMYEEITNTQLNRITDLNLLHKTALLESVVLNSEACARIQCSQSKAL